MTVEELEAEAERIAARRADHRTPAVVRRALLAPCGLTLRGFLALEEAGSPLLDGQWPCEDAAAMAQAFCTAWEAVFPGRALPPAAEAGEAIAEMAREVAQGFATLMPMRARRLPGEAPAPEVEDGLGWVARLVGRFAAKGWEPARVLDLPLDQLFLLTAGLAASDGMECAGEDYRDRRVETEDRRAERDSGVVAAVVVPRHEITVGDVPIPAGSKQPEQAKEDEQDANSVEHRRNIP